MCNYIYGEIHLQRVFFFGQYLEFMSKCAILYLNVQSSENLDGKSIQVIAEFKMIFHDFNVRLSFFQVALKLQKKLSRRRLCFFLQNNSNGLKRKIL